MELYPPTPAHSGSVNDSRGWAHVTSRVYITTPDGSFSLYADDGWILPPLR